MADELQTDQTGDSAQLAAEAHAVALAQATSTQAAAREFAIAAMARGEMTELQAADYMLAHARAVVRVKDAAGGEPSEPAPADPYAVERLLTQYPDTSQLSERERRFCRYVSPRVDAEQVLEVVNLVRTLKPMTEQANREQWSPEFTMKELERRHGEKRAAALVGDAHRVWSVFADGGSFFEDDWIENFPDAIEKVAAFSDTFFSSAAGRRVTLQRSEVARAAEERERAEAAEQQRRADERFGFGAGR